MSSALTVSILIILTLGSLSFSGYLTEQLGKAKSKTKLLLKVFKIREDILEITKNIDRVIWLSSLKSGISPDTIDLILDDREDTLKRLRQQYCTFLLQDLKPSGFIQPEDVFKNLKQVCDEPLVLKPYTTTDEKIAGLKDIRNKLSTLYLNTTFIVDQLNTQEI